jgi:hypothetical protein
MPQIMPRMIVAGNGWGDNCPSTSAATRTGNRKRRQDFGPTREGHRLHGAIALSDQAGIMTFLPLNLRFGFEDALQKRQDGSAFALKYILRKAVVKILSDEIRRIVGAGPTERDARVHQGSVP